MPRDCWARKWRRDDRRRVSRSMGHLGRREVDQVGAFIKSGRLVESNGFGSNAETRRPKDAERKRKMRGLNCALPLGGESRRAYACILGFLRTCIFRK